MYFTLPSAATLALALTSTLAPAASATHHSDYEYIVIGSGAGGGPLAARLALAGHRTLLIEAGDDQGLNINYTVPAFSALSSEDPALAWNFFVRHYADDERQARDYKTTYELSGGGEYTGLQPPWGARMKGTLYPRAGTLGGCSAHNALLTVYPHRSDFDKIAELTGDSSWSATNMRKYFVKMENNDYLTLSSKGHGYRGWLSVQTPPLGIVLKDFKLLNMVFGGAAASGRLVRSIIDLVRVLAGDANADSKIRDREGGYFQIPLTSRNGARNGPRELLVQVRDAKNKDGRKMYPLDIRMNCHVTKVTFDESQYVPRATGVEFLDGAYLYKAIPLSKDASSGRPGSAAASKEVIVAGGAYNSPQILKLSGIGPTAELRRFNLPVVVDLPGVGTNLQDHYEVAVQGRTESDFSAFEGCGLNPSGEDKCLEKWESRVFGDRGICASSGLAATMMVRSSVADEYDTFVFGGPINYRGYFPGYSVNVSEKHDWFSWTVLKAHPRNTAGSVTLQSADPLDMPSIVYNYFDTGDGDADHDLTAMIEAVAAGRRAFEKTYALTPTTEVLPGTDVTGDEAVRQYIKDTAWGHHASCTCPIGADGDRMAVLDSKFRVRGVKGLRVVDASVYPRIPGSFTAVSTYMVGEKAADVILAGE